MKINVTFICETFEQASQIGSFVTALLYGLRASNITITISSDDAVTIARVVADVQRDDE